MTKENVAATDAMVNMDTLGLAPTEIWARHSERTLNSALLYVAKQLNPPVTGVNVEQVGSTDSEPFSARKIPSHYHPFADSVDVEHTHLAHVESQDFRCPAGRLLPDVPATLRVYRCPGRSAATAGESKVGSGGRRSPVRRFCIACNKRFHPLSEPESLLNRPAPELHLPG
jgi:hypothetical protein